MAGDGKPAHRVVIVGGGFGGLLAAKNLKKAAVEVTLIDRRNFHLFQPLLYQVATGGLSPANIAAPLRAILRKQRNAKVVLGEVVGFDVDAKTVQLKDGAAVPFDTLVLATGATHHYFGHDEWADRAPGLKTIEDATEIRRRILSAFEKAEREPDPAALAKLLTFVVVGGGPTGVEMAGAVRELATKTMRYDFRNFDPAACRVILVEGQTRVLSMFHETLSAKALTMLAKLGVEVVLDAHVTSVEAGAVVVKADDKADGPTRIETDTIMWAAGVRASGLGKLIADAVGGVEVDRAGRVLVDPDCTLGKRDDIFVVGDMATLKGADGKPLPGVAPVAMQQGEYVAAAIQRRLAGETPGGAFKYFDKGSMATIGAAKAIAQTGRIRLSGFVAWLAWLFIHILYLARFENRVLVMFQWFWNYATRNRTARLITGERAATTTAVNEVARAK